MKKNQKPKTPTKPGLRSGPLGFGVYFTPHMATLKYTDTKGWHDPQIEPYRALQLDPAASALHYGQAMFEGMKAFRGVDNKIRIFRPGDHIERMISGAGRLCMPTPPPELVMKLIQQLVLTDEAWVPPRERGSLYIRPTLIGTEAFLGVRPSREYLFFCILSPVGSYYSQNQDSTGDGVDIFVEMEQSRVAPGGLGEVKAAANYAASLMAAARAKERGFAQVLWLDACQKRWIEEVGTMNVFFKFKDVVVTPNLSGTILGGITRRTILELLANWEIPNEQRPISLDEVLKALASGELLEILGTGTAAVVSSVRSLEVEGKRWVVPHPGKGSLAERLKGAIQSVQYGVSEDQFGWMITL